MTDRFLPDAWKSFLLRAARPIPALTLLCILCFAAIYSSNHGQLHIPAPAPYNAGSSVAACSASQGAAYCEALAVSAQRHSFVLQWVGWALTIAGGLFAAAMALREESPSAADPNAKRLFSPKNWAILLASVGAAVAAVGAQAIERASGAAQAAADATEALGELALIALPDKPVAPENSVEAIVCLDAGVAEDAGLIADAATQIALQEQPAQADAGASCARLEASDRTAFQHCAQIKAQWLSGRTMNSFLDSWQKTIAGNSAPTTQK